MTGPQVFTWHLLSHTQLHNSHPLFLTAMPSLVSQWVVLFCSSWLLLFAWSLSASVVSMPTDKASTSQKRTRQQTLPACFVIVHRCGLSHLRWLSLSSMERASLLRRKMSSTFSPLFNDKLFSYIFWWPLTYMYIWSAIATCRFFLSIFLFLFLFVNIEMYSAHVH